MNPVRGAARHFARTVDATREPAHPPAASLPPQRVRHRFAGRAIDLKPMKCKPVDQLLDGGTPHAEQMHREHVAQFDTPQGFHSSDVRMPV
jgi:hypothetical protein